MGKRIKLTKTDMFLLGLTVLFILAVALTWLMTPRQVRGDYEIQAAQPAEAPVSPQVVNINTAGVDELDSLPGIGPVLAQRIVDYRTAHGAFRSTEELTQVEGIGQAILENIQNMIVTEDTQE